MSYILDALRRADAERGRGGVPGLHTQATPVPGASPAQRSSASASLVVVGAAVLAVAALATGGTWWAMQRNAPSGGVVLAGAQTPSSPAVPVTASPAAQTTAPPASVAAAPLAPAPAPANPPPVAAAVPIPPPAAERRTAPSPRERPAPTAATPRATTAEAVRNRAADEAPQERAPAPAVARPAEPSAAPAPTGTVFAQSDLPDAVRTQLPVLKISGATYSANPMHRMAIVNGQVLHEGDVAAPGLMLEKIEPTRTIWSFKGFRYGLASQ